MRRPSWRRSVFAGLLSAGVCSCFEPAVADELGCPPLRLATAPSEVPAPHARGLLWRISKGGAAPSFLFGTIHLGDADLVDLPGPVADALDDSRQFVMEAHLEADDLLRWSGRMLYEEPDALRSALGHALFERAMALLLRYGIPEAVGAQLKPWALYLTLSTPPDAGGLPLDLVLAARAEDAGKKVEGLETVGEQAEILSGLPAEDQVALVRDGVCHYDALQGDIRQIKRLYLERDLTALAAMSQKYELSEAPRYRRLMQQVLLDRNDRMLARMVPYLSGGGVFIAVGALHLPGPRGLLAALEARGYTVEPVY